MCFHPPDGETANVHVDPLKGEQQTGQPVMLKGQTLAELTAVPQDTFLGQHPIDAIHPLPQIPAAALEDEPLHGLAL